MRRTLLVTNDFPPRQGGIQSLLESFVDQLPPDDIVVYAPAWKGADDFDRQAPYEVYRHPTSLMLPTPSVARRAAELIDRHDIHTVWFGAAAPLGLLAPAMRRAGAQRIIASTHGHEVGWSMLPGARQCLRQIGNDADVVTYVSKYTRGRFAAAFGRQAALEHLPPAVDSQRFSPDPVAGMAVRSRYDLEDKAVIVCLSRLVPRKGQDMLIRAMPLIVDRIPNAHLLIVGGGPYRKTLERLRHSYEVADAVTFTGTVPADELAAHHNAADVFAMPSRTRGKGLDVEGLGIVYLEASACGVPVVAGDSGGAPETVRNGETGVVVDGRNIGELAEAIIEVLDNPQRARDMGAAGREWVGAQWSWALMGERLRSLL